MSETTNIRPVIKQPTDFDASYGTTIEFIYDEGRRSEGSTLRVYKTSDFTRPVYTNTVYNQTMKNSINGGALENGEQYAAEIISYWYGDPEHSTELIPSEVSNKVYFRCITTPVFKFTNITDGEVYNNQSVLVELLYEQAEGIEISQFKYELYNSQGNLIEESERYSDYKEHNTFSFNGLENNAQYLIRAQGQTTKLQPLDTGYISIYVQFEAPDSYSILYANADNGNGVIEYNTNIKIIEPNRDVDTYKFESGLIDLEDDKIVYDTNFVLDGDFIMAVRHKMTVGEIMKCSNDNRGFSLIIIDCYADVDTNTLTEEEAEWRYKYKLVVPNDQCNYILYSSPFVMDEDKIITCWITRINNLYRIDVHSENDTSDWYNLYLGQARPMTDVTKYDVWIDLDVDPTIRIPYGDFEVIYQTTEPENAQTHDIWLGE